MTNELITEVSSERITILWQGGHKSEYTLATLDSLIAEFTKEIARFQRYRQRILAAGEKKQKAVEP
jgi:hypothetical protein